MSATFAAGLAIEIQAEVVGLIFCEGALRGARLLMSSFFFFFSLLPPVPSWNRKINVMAGALAATLDREVNSRWKPYAKYGRTKRQRKPGTLMTL